MSIQDNPLLNWELIPQFDKIEPEHVEPAVTAVLEETRTKLAALEAKAAEITTWEELFPDFERLTDRLYRVWGVVDHLNSVKNSEELRTAYNAMLPQVIAIFNQLGQSKPLFLAYKRLRESAAYAAYTPARKRILDGALRDAELAGVGLEGEAKERFNEIAARLGELSTQFSNNVLDETKEFKLVLETEEEIAGLPESLLQLAAATAVQNGHETASPENGPWIITLDQPSFVPFMKHSQRRDLREKVYTAYTTRAHGGERNNLPLIDEILELREEKAKILKFDTYANLSLSSKMAPSVTVVRNLLYELRAAARPAGEAELDDLIALAAKNGAPEAKNFQQWDTPFWAERLREEEYELNEEALRPYFPLPRVLEGMFSLVEELFEIDVVKAAEQPPVWHPDVEYFDVLNSAGQKIAGFYLDAYSRPSEKRGGAWMGMLLQRSAEMAPEGADVRLPVAYMNCNQTPPGTDKPSLMTFTEVITLYHEFGHALQHMLTNVDEGLAAGLANVEWDAVEIASQFMENWCYHPETLKKMARHYQTGEVLPDDIIAKLLAVRTFRSGYATLRQVSFGLLDFALHHDYDREQDGAPLEVQKRVMNETMILPQPEDNAFIAGFGHIFAGGYAAGYYSYKWSEVLSADAFAAFEEVGLEDETAVQTLGKRYRDTILALGGSQHPMDVYLAFRGQQPSTEHLLRHNGLA